MGQGGRQRVLVAGGGMAALTFVFWLTEQPGWEERFEIVVLQPGWRLGGKLASGRNAAVCERIEEHGLHVWSGFYENAFTVIQRVYRALGRPPGAPLATWTEAFTPWRDVSWAQRIDGSWRFLETLIPGNSVAPGAGGLLTSPAGLLARMVWFAVRFLRHRPFTWVQGVTPAQLRISFQQFVVGLILAALGTVIKLERAVGARIIELILIVLLPLVWLARWVLHRIIDHTTESPGLLFEVLVFADLALAYVEGLSRDRVLSGGFDRINRYELNEWLTRYHVHHRTLTSGFVRGTYSYVFAFRGGDSNAPELEAGTGVRLIFRLLLAGCTAIFWHMNAGAGDTVIAPMYLVLEARGVEFRFFEVVRGVTVDDAGSITDVDVGRQVTIKPEVGDSGYQPLVDVKGLPCWRAEPDYDQIVEGAELRERHVNLESFWTDWEDVDRASLRRGRDFDLLVWGASLPTLSVVAPSMLDHSEALRRAASHVPTVPTQAMQVWLDVDTAQLGGPDKATIMTAFAEPFDTWADMSHLLVMEDWPPDEPPRSVQYFCGALAETTPPPPPPDPAYPLRVTGTVENDGRSFLGNNGVTLWPQIAVEGSDPPAFDWTRLHAVRSGDRFEQQFWRANIDPSERYAQSPVGAAQARPAPDGTGIGGLLVVGDWVKTGLDYGCIEAAVMSGLIAARVVCGSPQYVYGESDFPPFADPVP